MNQLLFHWWLHEGGYRVREWTPPRGQKDKFITCNDRAVPITNYPLEDHPELYLKFSRLNWADEWALVAFANAHGLLGGGRGDNIGKEVQVRTLEGDGGRVSSMPAESLKYWGNCIRSVDTACRVWFAITEGDVKALEKEFAANLIRGKRRGGSYATFETKAVRAELGASEPIEITDFAQRKLSESLNAGLRDVQVIVDPHADGLGVQSRTLLGALWFQISDAVASGRRLKQCERAECPNRFEVNPADKRQLRRLYCSDVCRVTAGRAVS